MSQSTIFDHFSPRFKMKVPEAPFTPTRTGTGVNSRTGGSQRARFEAHFKSGSPSGAGTSKANASSPIGDDRRDTARPRRPSPEVEYDSDDDFALDRITLTQHAEPIRRDMRGKRSRRVSASSEEEEEGEEGEEVEIDSGNDILSRPSITRKRPRVVLQEEDSDEEEVELLEASPIADKSASSPTTRTRGGNGRRIAADEEDDSVASADRKETSSDQNGGTRQGGSRRISNLAEDEDPEEDEDEPVAVQSTRQTRSRDAAQKSASKATKVVKATGRSVRQARQTASTAEPKAAVASEPIRRSTRRPPPIVIPPPTLTSRSTRTAPDPTPTVDPPRAQRKSQKGAAANYQRPRSARSSSQVLLSIEVPPLSALEKLRYSPYFESEKPDERPVYGEDSKRRAQVGGADDAVRGQESAVSGVMEGDDAVEMTEEADQDVDQPVEVASIGPTPLRGTNTEAARPIDRGKSIQADTKAKNTKHVVLSSSPARPLSPPQFLANAPVPDATPVEVVDDRDLDIIDVDSDVEVVAVEKPKKGMNGTESAAPKAAVRFSSGSEHGKGEGATRTKTAKDKTRPSIPAKDTRGAKSTSTKRPRPPSPSSTSSSSSPPPQRARPKHKDKKVRPATRPKFRDPDASTSSESSSDSASDSDVRPAKGRPAPKQPVKIGKSTNKPLRKKRKKQKKRHDPDSSSASSASTSEEDMVAEIEMDEAERFRTETRLRRKKKETPAQRSMRKLRARRLGIIEVTSSSSSYSSESGDDGLVRGLSYDSGDESDYLKARSQRVNRNRAEVMAEDKARRAKQAHARSVGKLPRAAAERLDEYDSDSDFIEDDGGVVPDHLLPHQFSLNSTQSPEYKYKVVFHYLLLLVMGGPKTLPLKGELKEYLMPNVYDLRRRLGGLRDGSVRSQIWRTDFVRALEKYPQFDTVELDFAEPGCDACHISTRMSTKRVQMGGYPYDKDTHEPLDSDGSDSDDSDDSLEKDGPPNYLMGKFCHARARVFHALSHWEDDLYEHIKGYYHDLLRALDRPVPDDSEASSSSSDSDSDSDSSSEGGGGKKHNGKKADQRGSQTKAKRGKKGKKDGHASDSSDGSRDARREQLLARRARTAERVKRLKHGTLVKKGQERDVNAVMAWMDAKGYPKQTFMIMENLTRTATNLEHDKSRDD